MFRCPLYPNPGLGKLLLASLNDTEVGASFILLYRLPLMITHGGLAYVSGRPRGRQGHQ